MACPPKRAGTSQFQRLMTIKLISAAAAMPNRINFNTRAMRRPFMVSPRLFSREFLVNRFQAPPQVQDGVMLARKQRIDAYARLGGEFLEAAPFEFVRDENLALFLGQLVDRGIELVEQDAARVSRLRTRLGRREQVFERQRAVRIA